MRTPGSRLNAQDAMFALPGYANETATVFSGAVRLAQDIADQMHAEAEQDKSVDSVLVSEWVSRLDFLFSAMGDSNDKLLEKLMEAGQATVWVSSRNVARQNTWAEWQASVDR